ncbi:methyltransferase domain-containing protein [Streptomyces sp. NPDC090112]|uniref:methyltransferase domain-containing protein n=1 Tax=Streptomyces sp. NPDC090112 TaxID=3365949 RepID=UPI00381CA97B
MRRLLRGVYVAHAVGVGGPQAPLSAELGKYAENVTRVDPGMQPDRYWRADAEEGSAKTYRSKISALPFKSATVDLITIGGISNPAAVLKEVSRALRPEGLAILEVANSAHFLNRLRPALGKTPGNLYLEACRREGVTLPTGRHIPSTFARIIEAGFVVDRKLSVSNFRNFPLWAYIPTGVLNSMERSLQYQLGKWEFGPRLFYLLRKVPRYSW